jgi:hypothetical protein
MGEDIFRTIEQTVQSEGPEAAFNLLVRRALEEKKYRLVFEVRQMQNRHALGLSLVDSGSPAGLSGEQRAAYEQRAINAARETGNLFLADGDIASAWPYFRAIGEIAPIAEALDRVEGGENVDAAIEIAFQHGINPRKGFELILKNYGTCRAITFFGGYQDQASRPAALQFLVRSLYMELAASIRRVITDVEGQSPQDDSVAVLTADRPWLFEGMSYHVDPSHLTSVLKFSADADDPETLRLATELADYGQRLAPMFHFRGDPPFEDAFLDYGVFLRALLGQDTAKAVEHFRNKVTALPELTMEQMRSAEVLVNLLVRLGDYRQAIEISLNHLSDVDARELGCPSVLELCQMAGEYGQLKSVAQQRGDTLAFLAGVIQSPA